MVDQYTIAALSYMQKEKFSVAACKENSQQTFALLSFLQKFAQYEILTTLVLGNSNHGFLKFTKKFIELQILFKF